VIDGTTNSVIDTALDFSVYGVNPVTHKLYTPNGTANTVTVIDESVNSTTAVAAGTNPSAAAVNPATNTAYLTNSGSNNVTVINGATNSTTTIAAGTDPDAVAVNPVTNTAYVANFRSDTVTVINGATGSTATVATGTQPVDVAINPATDTIYVANSDSGNVTVIAGATNSTATVEVGTNPAAIAVNPITNSAYVANEGSNNVTVISGFANHTSTIPVGNQPDAVAANPVTNMIYVANLGSDSVSVVNGATNTVSATVAAGGGPSSIAVDPISNTVYVANKFSGSLTVINGATNSATTVSTGVAPSRIAIDPANNKVYTANSGSNNITAIDGASNAANTVAAGTAPVALAANPATDTVYAANSGSGNATVLTPNAIAAIPLTTAVQGVVDSQTVAGLAIYATTNPSPSFTAVATSSYTPIAPPPTAVYYQLDTEQGPWQMATDTTALGANPATFGFQLSGVALGVHVVYAYATYGLEATTGASWVERIGKAPEIGNITAYVFAVLALPPTPTSVTLASSLNPSLFGQSVTFTATVNPSVGPTGTITFFDASTALATVGLASGMATYTTSSLAVGTHPMTAAYSGDDNYSPSTSPVLNQVVLLPVATGDFAISASPAAQIVKGGSEAAYNVTVTSLDGFAGPVGLSCSGLPADATCSFAQSTVILVANGTAQTTMTVSTTAADAELRRFGNSDLGFGTSKPSAHGGDTAALFARMIVPFDCSGLAVFLAGVLGRRNAKRRRRRSLRVLGLVALTLVLVGMTSCGCPSTVHQDYTITVTGTSGTLVHSTSVELIVDLQKNQ
jgi:YVTN family beta-propeller protein